MGFLLGSPSGLGFAWGLVWGHGAGFPSWYEHVAPGPGGPRGWRSSKQGSAAWPAVEEGPLPADVTRSSPGNGYPAAAIPAGERSSAPSSFPGSLRSLLLSRDGNGESAGRKGLLQLGEEPSAGFKPP